MTVLGRSLRAIRAMTHAAAQRAANPARRASHHVLTVAGLGCLSAAAWTIALPAGLVVIGLSCFILDWQVKGE